MATETVSLSAKNEYFEFPSIVVARLVKGPSANYLEKIRSVFDVDIHPKPSQTAPFRYQIKGIVSDVDLVISLLKDVSHEATVLSEKEQLRDKQAVNISHFKMIEQHLAIAVPGYASRRGEEKRMERMAKRAADHAADQVRRTFSVVAQPSAVQSSQTEIPKAPVTTQKPLLPKLGKIFANMITFTPRNDSQAILKTALNDPSVTIAFAVGAAGGGKSFVPVYHGFDQIRSGEKEKVILLRPRTTTGQKDMGAVGGDIHAKMRPYLAAQENNIIKITGQHIGELVKKNLLILDTADLIRGDTFENAVVIVDEAQNFAKGTITAIATRLGENSQMIFTGDISSNQNDMGLREPGLSYLLAKFIYSATQDRGMAEKLAVVSYAPEDSAARSETMPFILKALASEPDDFIEISDAAQRPYERELAENIERNRLTALKLSEKFSIITENRFGRAALDLTINQPAALASGPIVRLARG